MCIKKIAIATSGMDRTMAASVFRCSVLYACFCSSSKDAFASSDSSIARSYPIDCKEALSFCGSVTAGLYSIVAAALA